MIWFGCARRLHGRKWLKASTCLIRNRAAKFRRLQRRRRHEKRKSRKKNFIYYVEFAIQVPFHSGSLFQSDFFPFVSFSFFYLGNFHSYATLRLLHFSLRKENSFPAHFDIPFRNFCYTISFHLWLLCATLSHSHLHQTFSSDYTLIRFSYFSMIYADAGSFFRILSYRLNLHKRFAWTKAKWEKWNGMEKGGRTILPSCDFSNAEDLIIIIVNHCQVPHLAGPHLKMFS